VTTIRVTDAQRCEPSEDLHVLKPLAASFFESDGTVIPVIDTRKLFGASGKNLMTW
jgi:hypothetical protein